MSWPAHFGNRRAGIRLAAQIPPAPDTPRPRPGRVKSETMAV